MENIEEQKKLLENFKTYKSLDFFRISTSEHHNSGKILKKVNL